MKKTKIEWCDSTWNPVTGCLHNCEYCYARKIAERFKGCDKASTYSTYCQATWKRLNPESEPKDALFEIYPKCPTIKIRFDAKAHKNICTRAPYPWGFQPTLHGDKLDEPSRWIKPRTIFVCSMADLFGDWVPDSWIEEVFTACEKAPQHRYLFLTKNPKRYEQYGVPMPENNWYGVSLTHETDMSSFNLLPAGCNSFVSMEPILEDLHPEKHNILFRQIDWVIIGAETGSRKDKVVPKPEWIEEIVAECEENNVPVFMKDSLIPVVGEENMRRELPWEKVF